LTQHGVLLHPSDAAALVCPPPRTKSHSTKQHQSNQHPSLPPSACIAHNTTILTECTTSATSQTSSLASLILPKIDHSSPQKLTYTHGSNHIHYIAASPSEYPPAQPTAGGLTYLVISDSSTINRRISFGFLVELRRRFLSPQYFAPESTDFSDLPNYGAAAFNGEMRALMVEYGTTARGRDDALGNAQREIEDVRGIMTRNIEGLLERGERIDLLVDKTDRLGGSASEFRVRSRGLKRRMWWKNVKLMGLLALVVVLILVTVVVSVKNSV
jgi:vesicle-associated membrane protein 7